MSIIKKTSSVSVDNFTRIYQYADGTWLPDTSQPNISAGYEITARKYTPHISTRYINVTIGKNGIPCRCTKDGQMVEPDKKLPELYSVREECCGCTACYAVCPADAITMHPCEEGFLYPVVNALMCIRCYECIGVCPINGYHKDF